MQNNLYEIHKHCEMLINYTRLNAHKRPALCCATCKDKKGRPQWIDWVAIEDEDYLVEGLCVEQLKPELGEHDYPLNMQEFMKKNSL